MSSIEVALPLTRSTTHCRPRTMAATSLARVSALIGRLSGRCAEPAGGMMSRAAFDGGLV
jgi:hypothetical protein